MLKAAECVVIQTRSLAMLKAAECVVIQTRSLWDNTESLRTWKHLFSMYTESMLSNNGMEPTR